MAIYEVSRASESLPKWFTVPVAPWAPQLRQARGPQVELSSCDFPLLAEVLLVGSQNLRPKRRLVLGCEGISQPKPSFCQPVSGMTRQELQGSSFHVGIRWDGVSRGTTTAR